MKSTNNIFKRIQQAFKNLTNPKSTLDSFRIIITLQTFAGLLPYKVNFYGYGNENMAKSKIRNEMSKLGITATLLNISLYLLCQFLWIYMDNSLLNNYYTNTSSSITLTSIISDYLSVIVTFLHFLCTFNIFLITFTLHEKAFKRTYLISKLELMLQEIGIDLKAMYKQFFRIGCVIGIIWTSVILGVLINGLLYYNKTEDNNSIPFILIRCFVTVIPSIYIQIIIFQYIIEIIIITLHTKVLNSILLKINRQEQELNKYNVNRNDDDVYKSNCNRNKDSINKYKYIN